MSDYESDDKAENEDEDYFTDSSQNESDSDEDEEKGQDDKPFFKKRQRVELEKFLHKELCVDAGSTSITDVNIETLVARQTLGMTEPLDSALNKRYSTILKKKELETFLVPLAQPMDTRRLKNGKLQKASLPLGVLIDPTDLVACLPDPIPETAYKHILGKVKRVETKFHLTPAFTVLESTFTTACIFRMTVAWRKLASLLMIPLGNCQEKVLQTEERRREFQMALKTALSAIHYELANVNIIFQPRVEKKKMKNYQQQLLLVHNKRLRELPVSEDSNRATRKNDSSFHNSLFYNPLDAAAVKKETKRQLDIRVKELGKNNNKKKGNRYNGKKPYKRKRGNTAQRNRPPRKKKKLNVQKNKTTPKPTTITKKQ